MLFIAFPVKNDNNNNNIAWAYMHNTHHIFYSYIGLYIALYALCYTVYYVMCAIWLSLPSNVKLCNIGGTLLFRIIIIIIMLEWYWMFCENMRIHMDLCGDRQIYVCMYFYALAHAHAHDMWDSVCSAHFRIHWIDMGKQLSYNIYSIYIVYSDICVLSPLKFHFFPLFHFAI